jgi:hypothetical protein
MFWYKVGIKIINILIMIDRKNVKIEVKSEMDEKKVELTYEEIVKALERMANSLSGTSGYTVDIIPYALDLIHRLQDENGKQVRMRCNMQRKFDDLQELCIEQKAEIERLNKCVMSEEQVRKCCADIIQETRTQAVKDTAKEIYNEIGDNDILVITTQEYGSIEVVPLERLQEIIKNKGVEVE